MNLLAGLALYRAFLRVMYLTHLQALILLHTKPAASDQVSSAVFRVYDRADWVSSGVTSSSELEGSFDCAISCLIRLSECDGFSYNATSAVCDLQHDIFCYLNHTGSVTSAVVMSQIKQPCSYSTELARNKTATSSSQETWASGGFRFASYGNDGITTEDLFFETKNTSNPWWRCDLERTHAVTAFNLVNRQDCCSERAHNLLMTVAVLEDEIMDNWNNRCGYIDGQIGDVHLVSCPRPLIGRFVQVQANTTTKLHLEEVQVFGYYVNY